MTRTCCFLKFHRTVFDFFLQEEIQEPNVRMSKEGFDYNDFFKGVVSALVVVGGVFEQ